MLLKKTDIFYQSEQTDKYDALLLTICTAGIMEKTLYEQLRGKPDASTATRGKYLAEQCVIYKATWGGEKDSRLLYLVKGLT